MYFDFQTYSRMLRLAFKENEELLVNAVLPLVAGNRKRGQKVVAAARKKLHLISNPPAEVDQPT